MTPDSAQTCHTVTLRDSSFSVQRVQLSSDADNTAVAAVVARSPGVPCQDSPLTCAGVSAGCLLCIVTTLCHEPRYLRICHAVSQDVTLCHAAPGHRDRRVSSLCAAPQSAHHWPRPPSAAHILLYTSHVTCVHLYILHVTCVHLYILHLTCHMYTLYMCVRV